MEGTNSTPNLQTILSTLAQFAAPIQNAAAVERTPTPAGAGNEGGIGHDDPKSTTHGTVIRAEDPRLQLRPQSRANATPSPKPIDPGTITTWQDGLRCVTKIAAQNTQFSAAIKKMMTDQRKHEQRWYSERQNLKLTQANRATSAARAQSILQGLGGNASQPVSEAESNASNEAELAAFDRRIYDAQVQMEATMTMELKGLGVPFFGTESSLVVSDEKGLGSSDLRESQPKWSPLVTEKQLIELRRRMVGHLEDLYRD